ncbi:MAG TPA: hypothetical protein VGB77_13505, partial [Abditibacteriaceae bacterium]
SASAEPITHRVAEAYYLKNWAYGGERHLRLQVTPWQRGIMRIWIRTTLSYSLEEAARRSSTERHFSAQGSEEDQQGFPAQMFRVEVQ